MKRTGHTFRAAGLVIAGVIVLAAPHAGAAGDLITYWKFDEVTAGATASDSTSSAFHGTPLGNLNGAADPAYQPQPSTDVPPTTFNNPRSLFFQGDGGTTTGSYLDVSNWTVDTSNGFTVSLWAKPTGGGAWERFIDFGNGPGSDNIVFAQHDTGDRVFFEVYDGGGTTKITGPCGSWMYGSWHYYTATIDANGNATIYVDGQPVASGVTNKPVNIVRSNKYIGKSNWGDSYYEGHMDDVRIYGRALTQAEVIDLTNGGPGPGVSLTGQALNPNGLTDAEEDAAPNGGDGNNDGVSDKTQPHVASYSNTQTGQYVTVATASARTLTGLSSAAASQNATTDSGYTYPTGFINYSAQCGTPGYTAPVTVFVYGAAGQGLVLRKYDPNAHTYTTVSGATVVPVTIGGQAAAKVTYAVTDGGALDSDGQVNGVIVDPVGLGLPPAAAAVTAAASAPGTALAAARPAGTLAETGDAPVYDVAVALVLIVSALGVAFLWRAPRTDR